MRHDLLRRLQRLFGLISLLLLISIGLLAGQELGIVPADLYLADLVERWNPPAAQIALISGHAGYDSGAVCEDSETGSAGLREDEVNAAVAKDVALRLEVQGYRVMVLEEYDARLNGLRSDLLLSLHADSCVALSGYKAAHRQDSSIPQLDAAVVDCIDVHYSESTGLSYHATTITHDMLAYHAFRRIHPQTPAAILEMGFLGGDGQLLTDRRELVVRGIVESALCFFESQQAIRLPSPS